MNKRKRLAYWRNYHRYALSVENTYTPLMQKELLLQLKAVINNLHQSGIDQTLNSLNDIVNSDGVKRALLRMWYGMFPRRAETVTNQLEAEYATELVRKKFFDTPNRYWSEIINEYIMSSLPDQLAEITEFSKEWIRRQIQKGLEQQMSVDEMVQFIIGNDISASRARSIVRTNITTITNGAGKAAAKETKLLLRKFWISAQDNRTRRLPRDRYDHLHMDGVAVNIDEKFNVNGDLIDYPGDPHGAAANIIMCRCTTAYEAVRDSSGRIIRNEYTTVIGARRLGGQQQIITI